MLGLTPVDTYHQLPSHVTKLASCSILRQYARYVAQQHREQTLEKLPPLFTVRASTSRRSTCETLPTTNAERKMQMLSQDARHHQDTSNVKKANSVLHHLAPRFLESIAISSEGLYAFITQVEVYLRHMSGVDDCANSASTLGYPANPLNKNENFVTF